MELVKKGRPKVLDSITERIQTGCGYLYVTIGFEEAGTHPIEIRAALGKAGGCSNCQLEALNRAVSLGLQYGIPPQEFVRELKGHKCPSPQMWPEDAQVLSCPDGVAKALERYISPEGEE